MAVKFSSTAMLPRVSSRSVAVGCIGLAGVGVAASILILWPPVTEALQAFGLGGGRPIGPGTLLQLLPVASGLLGVFGGVLCLRAAPLPLPAAANGLEISPPSPALSSGLVAVVQELRAVLADERNKITAFQEVCSANTREARIVSAHVARLGEAALDAETRLDAGVAKAAAALMQSGSGDLPAAEIGQAVERLLPQIADLISRRMAEQTRATAATIDSAIGRLATAEDGSVQTFRAAVADAVRHMTALGDTTIGLHRDVIALDTAGREIATASAMVVSRLGGAVAHVDAAMAHLPAAAAAAVTAGTEEAVQALAEASATLRADSEEREAIALKTRLAADALRKEAASLALTKQDIADAAQLAVTTVARTAETAAASLAAVIADADEARHASSGLVDLTAALGKVAATLEDGVANLDAAGLRVAAAAESAACQLAVETARTEAALSVLPGVAAGLTAAAETASAYLSTVTTEADAARDRSTNLGELTSALENAATTFVDGVGSLDAAGQRLAAAGESVAGDAARTEAALAGLPGVASGLTAAAETAASYLVAVIAEAGEARQKTTHLAELTIALENAAATLVNGAANLDSAALRVAVAGEGVAGQLAVGIARAEAAVSGLPDVAAGLTAAAADLRHETRFMTAATQQMSAAGASAASAVTDVAARAAVSAASLDTAGHMMSAASADVAIQIERLSEAVREAEVQASLAPDAAVQIAATAARLQALTDRWPPEATLTALPETAARLEAAAAGLDRLDALSGRLENAAAGLQETAAPEAEVTVLTALSHEICEAVRRVEVALAHHEDVWPTLAASVAQVEAAAAVVAQAAADQSSEAAGFESGEGSPLAALAVDDPPAALAATLRRLDQVSSQSEALLLQAEVLAEAVINGRALGLPPLLADRTPVLLASIEAITGRLRSVATALALVSDGVPTADRRFG